MILTKRVRVNVGTSVKGIITGDHTVEITAEYDPDNRTETPVDIRALVLAESDSVQAAIFSRYPVAKS